MIYVMRDMYVITAMESFGIPTQCSAGLAPRLTPSMFMVGVTPVYGRTVGERATKTPVIIAVITGRTRVRFIEQNANRCVIGPTKRVFCFLKDKEGAFQLGLQSPFFIVLC